MPMVMRWRFTIFRLIRDFWKNGRIPLAPFTFSPVRHSAGCPSAEGALSNEWASEVSIKPLAKLALDPEDFPFLEQIGGHDDSVLVRVQELTKQVINAVTHYESEPEQLRMQLDWKSELGPVLLEFVEKQRMFMSTATLTLQFEPDAVWLHVAGPPAYLQVLQNRLNER